MQRTKAFFYVSLGILALALSFHLGAQVARGQTGTARQLTHPPSGYVDLHPAFSPDGYRVVFGRQAFTGGTDLMVADVATGATGVLVPQAQLPPNWSPNAGISWSPDGTHIAISGDNSNAVWIVDLMETPIATQRETWGRIKADRR